MRYAVGYQKNERQASSQRGHSGRRILLQWRRQSGGSVDVMDRWWWRRTLGAALAFGCSGGERTRSGSGADAAAPSTRSSAARKHPWWWLRTLGVNGGPWWWS